MDERYLTGEFQTINDPPEALVILREAIAIRFVEHAIRDAPAMADRALAVAGHVFDSSLPRHVEEQLAFVARLFVRGWHVDGAVRARGALEAALKDRGPDEAAILADRSPAKSASAQIALRERIRSAEKRKRLSKEAGRCAEAVVVAGNRGAHPERFPMPEGDNYVSNLAVVLRELYAARG